MDAVRAFRKRGMNPDNPEAISFCEPAETFMQHREALNKFYDRVPDVAEGYMQKSAKSRAVNTICSIIPAHRMPNLSSFPWVLVPRPSKKRSRCSSPKAKRSAASTSTCSVRGRKTFPGCSAEYGQENRRPGPHERNRCQRRTALSQRSRYFCRS